ncbi:MAG: type II toxin-antitoxin system HicB family antitoxin [Gammaproteobacteria bacterium]
MTSDQPIMTHSPIWPAEIRPDDEGRYLVTFPDLPEALTDGATLGEAWDEAADCLEEALAGRINRDEEIPVPGKIKRGQYKVFLDPQFMLKVLLYVHWRAANITKTELAGRMQVRESEVRRLLDPHYGSKLPQMEKAFAALGARITVSLEKVA